MIVFRVLQIAIAAFTIFFLGYSIYIFSSGGDQSTGDPYFEAKLYLVLFFAGLGMSFLIHFIVKFLKKHL